MTKSAHDILSELRITLKSTADGRHYTTCPQCSHARKPANRKLPCLGVTIDRTGVGFFCNHCGWKGGAYYDAAEGAKVLHPAPPKVSAIPRSAQIAPAPRLSGQPAFDLALAVWRQTVEIAGTLGETYLTRHRLLDIFEGVQNLRFHPACPFGSNKHPCMVALYRDIVTDEAKAIHRTALTVDGRKIDRKALGPKKGCAIKLDDNADVTVKLTIAEGIETALAGAMLGFRPVWALGDARELAAFPVLAGIESITILVDKDVSGTGQAAALECSKRWTSAGREVFRVIPTMLGADMADVVRRSA